MRCFGLKTFIVYTMCILLDRVTFSGTDATGNTIDLLRVIHCTVSNLCSPSRMIELYHFSIINQKLTENQIHTLNDFDKPEIQHEPFYSFNFYQ